MNLVNISSISNFRKACIGYAEISSAVWTVMTLVEPRSDAIHMECMFAHQLIDHLSLLSVLQANGAGILPTYLLVRFLLLSGICLG